MEAEAPEEVAETLSEPSGLMISACFGAVRKDFAIDADGPLLPNPPSPLSRRRGPRDARASGGKLRLVPPFEPPARKENRS
jgi:hypothetical protein